MPTINASKKDYENAIKALTQYKNDLCEIIDTLNATISQTNANLQGDSNVQRINETLSVRMNEINQISTYAEKLARKLMNELEEIERLESIINS